MCNGVYYLVHLNNLGCIQVGILYLKCIVSVICQLTNLIFDMFSLIGGGQWKEFSFFPSPTMCPYCLTCTWLDNCEIKCKEDDRKLLLERRVSSGSWNSWPQMTYFVNLFWLVHIECHASVTRDRNVDFAVLIQITNLSANLFVFIFGSLITYSLK